MRGREKENENKRKPERANSIPEYAYSKLNLTKLKYYVTITFFKFYNLLYAPATTNYK